MKDRFFALTIVGGKGKRLMPLTEKNPKPLVKINGKPIIEHQINWMKSQGITDVLFLCGYKGKLISDRSKISNKLDTKLSYKNIIIIGLLQVLAIIPGVSRSGIVITASRFLNFDRIDSSKIAFYLSIPAISGASFLGLKDIFETGVILNLIFFYSIILSFVISYLTIKYFLIYIKKFNLNLFIYYRILLALILFVIVYN